MEPAGSGVCGAEEAASGPTAVCSVRIALNAKELARSAVCSAGEAASLVVMLHGNKFTKFRFSGARLLRVSERFDAERRLMSEHVFVYSDLAPGETIRSSGCGIFHRR